MSDSVYPHTIILIILELFSCFFPLFIFFASRFRSGYTLPSLPRLVDVNVHIARIPGQFYFIFLFFILFEQFYLPCLPTECEKKKSIENCKMNFNETPKNDDKTKNNRYKITQRLCSTTMCDFNLWLYCLNGLNVHFNIHQK